MKRTVGLFLLLIPLLFSSCSKSTTDGNSNSDSSQALANEESDDKSRRGTGTITPLSFSGENSANLYFSAMAERDGLVAIAYEDKDQYIDVYDIATGERLYQQRFDDDVLSLTKSYLPGFDLKIQHNGGYIELFSISSPEQLESFSLPDALLSKVKIRDDDYRSYTTFDIDPIHEVYVVSDIDGMHVRVGGKTTLIDKREISADVLKSNYPVLSEHDAFAPRFGDVKIINGGKTIAAVIYLPNSQVKENGVLLYDVDTAEKTWYPNIVDAVTGQLKFVSDEIILTSESIIDASNNTISVLDGAINTVLSFTEDGDEFIVAEYESLGGNEKGLCIYSNLRPDVTLYADEEAPGPSYDRIVALADSHLLLFGRDGLRLVSY